MKIEYSILSNHDEIESLIKLCDSSFIEGIVRRTDFEVILNKIRDNAVVIAAREESGIYVGYAAMYANDDINKVAYITMFGVREAYQKKGIGQKMMDKCVTVAKECGMVAIRLDVIDINDRGKSFYYLYGFYKIGYNSGRKTVMLEYKLDKR